MRMEQEVRRQRRRREEPKLAFEPGKVFGPDQTKGEDFNVGLARDSATYRARHGQGGDRYGTNRSYPL